MSQLIYAEESAVVPLKPATATARPAIRVNQANVIYPAADQPVHALKDINLTIRQGEFVSFIGPSGCGKTTLLRAIADLEPITSGEVLVELSIGTDGSVTDARVLRATPARTFDREALNAVKRWKFEPISSPTTTRRTLAFAPNK